MERYTIYCTEEQTKKALELGAPIEKICYALNEHWQDKTPTAEQMIGWLEEQGITVEMVKCETHWFARTYSDENTNFNKGRFFSRKEATLAAIDAALDYLSKLKD